MYFAHAYAYVKTSCLKPRKKCYKNTSAGAFLIKVVYLLFFPIPLRAWRFQAHSPRSVAFHQEIFILCCLYRTITITKLWGTRTPTQLFFLPLTWTVFLNQHYSFRLTRHYIWLLNFVRVPSFENDCLHHDFSEFCTFQFFAFFQASLLYYVHSNQDIFQSFLSAKLYITWRWPRTTSFNKWIYLWLIKVQLFNLFSVSISAKSDLECSWM